MSRALGSWWLVSIAVCLGCYASRERVDVDAGTDDAAFADAAFADVPRDAPSTVDAADTGIPDPIIDDPPPEPTGEPLRAVQISMGMYAGASTCALDDAGRVWCWGSLSWDVRPVYDLEFIPEPVQITPLPRLRQIGAYGNSHCGIDYRSQVWCWGLQRPTRPEWFRDMRPLPEPTLSPADAFFSECPGWEGRVRCDRLDDHPEVRDATDVVDYVTHATEYPSGCILSTNGRIWCFGAELWGSAGDGDTNDGHVQLDGFAVALGALRTASPCALTDTGELYCWGMLSVVQSEVPEDVGEWCRGWSSSRCVDRPFRLSSVPPLRALSRGLALCGVTFDDALWCWFEYEGCEPASPAPCEPMAPHRVEIEPVSSVAAGIDGVCALTRAGGVRCWNSPTAQHLRGDGTTTVVAPNRAPTTWVNGFVRE